MLKRILILPMVLLTFASGGLSAQQAYGWCGYALLEGLPLLANQLAVFEALTPPEVAASNPDGLFQYRFNQSRNAVIIEGCFGAYPTRDLIMSLLSQVIPYDAEGMAPDIATIDFDAGPVTEDQVVMAYVDDHLTYTVFAGTRDQSAAQARDYLAQHQADWEPPCDDLNAC